MEKNKGITLIALVITIIVLLILAGVTIATLTGDNGLLQKAGETRNTNIEAEGLERIQLAVMASHDNNGINTTSLAKNLSEINDLTDTNNNLVTENTEITLPIVVILNNKNYKINSDGNITLPIYIVKNGLLINTNYIIPDDDENSTLTQKDGYVEYYAFTPSQYKTGISWEINNSTNFSKVNMTWSAPERSDKNAWGATLCASNISAIYDYGTEKYPWKNGGTSYGSTTLFSNGSNVVTDNKNSTFNLDFKNSSNIWYIDLQTYYRASEGEHWRKFRIYDLYLE